jgi:hypothetical protein
MSNPGAIAIILLGSLVLGQVIFGRALQRTGVVSS